MKDGKDPNDFRMKIASLKLEHNTVLTKEEQIATLFSVAGEKYGSTILGELRLLESQEEDVTFDV